ncbi:DEAD/DEAH box helicase [Sclerotinia borealis F-4128]|uniref:DEAD/DEAH box helicase n=1 Tax=Sclerotinia borealis (strain F-4128) TaxID=1432307 RepID=W9CXY9_SCLBF|nr:DEAD/DEAH box helicase [Sclerotinia borealis F-4128]
MKKCNATRSGINHKTTIDVTRVASTTVSRVAVKRTFDELNDSESSRGTFSPVHKQRDFIRSTLNGDPGTLKASEIDNITVQNSSEYSQRRQLALTPTPTQNPLLDLAHPAYQLPKQLIENFAALGIISIYPWQSECLLRSGALAGERNLVYTAPTGGGKSLVADVLMLKKIIQNPAKKALLVLPYVALVQEKLRWLRKVVEGISKETSSREPKWPSMWRNRGDENTIRVTGFYGGSKSRSTWTDVDIAVCTIEKANSLVNAAIDDCSIGNLGVVVMDEIHFINDESRGYILELMATKLLSLEQGVQIVGMSATLDNADLLAKWLNNAKFYISNYRAVPVEEHLVFENAVYPASSSNRFYKTASQLNSQIRNNSMGPLPKPHRLIQTSQHKEFSNPLLNSVVALANETARSGYGVLVFCSNQVLEKTVPMGVAFHHAGLTTEERDLVAAAYDEGVLKVMVATCSLAAGINLPARRVILHGARMGSDLVGPSMLRQMRGRAGRKGKDEIGETYLCCQKSDLEAVAELMEAEIPSVESCLVPGKRGVKRALLEVIATKLATGSDSIDDYVKKTLLYHMIDQEELRSMVEMTLKDLLENQLVEQTQSYSYEATRLGLAIVASSLAPEDGLFVHKELRKSLEAFVLDGEMHVLYTFTPVQAMQGNINWQVFRKEVDILDESNLRVLGGSMKESTPEEIEIARVYKRFYTALQLRDLCNEMPVYAVARKYDLPRGTIQNLAQTCHGFAAGMIKFCEKMDWGALAAVLDHFSDRLKAGAKSDLLALAEITFIKSRTARIFWDNGYKTVGAVAAAESKELLRILLMAQPRKLRLASDDEEKYHAKLLAKAAKIVESANRIWERQMQQEIIAELPQDYPSHPPSVTLLDICLYRQEIGDVLGVKTADGKEHQGDRPILAAEAGADALFDFKDQLRPTAWTLGHIKMSADEIKLYKDLPVLFNIEKGFFMEPDEDNHELKICDEHPSSKTRWQTKEHSLFRAADSQRFSEEDPAISPRDDAPTCRPPLILCPDLLVRRYP